MEKFAEFRGEKLLLLHALNMVADGSPECVECLHFALHSHVVLHGGFRELALCFHKLGTFLFELIELGCSLCHRGCIPTGIEAEFSAGEKIENGAGHVNMVGRHGLRSISQNAHPERDGKQIISHERMSWCLCLFGFATSQPDRGAAAGADEPEFEQEVEGCSCVVPKPGNVVRGAVSRIIAK